MDLARIRVYIFDLDQTLVNTLHRFYETFNSTLEEAGGEPIGWSEFLERYKRDTLEELVPPGTSKRRFWGEFRRKYSGWIHEEDSPIEGAREVLEWIKRREGIVVVTTGRDADPSDIWWELEAFGLADLVDEVYTIRLQDPSHEDVPFSRKGLLMDILSRHGAKPEEALFVGDYWVDMRSGRKAGIITVGVLTGHEGEEKLRRHGADYVVDDISHIPEVVKYIESE